MSVDPEVLSGLHALAALGPAAVGRLADLAELRHAAAGEVVAREGSPARDLLVVVEGKVSVESHLPGRGAVVMSTAGPGDLVGWSWLVPPHRWHFDVVVSGGPATLVVLPAAAVDGVMAEDPRVGVELLREVIAAMAGRLEGARLQLLDVYGAGGRRG